MVLCKLPPNLARQRIQSGLFNLCLQVLPEDRHLGLRFTCVLHVLCLETSYSTQSIIVFLIRHYCSFAQQIFARILTKSAQRQGAIWVFLGLAQRATLGNLINLDFGRGAGHIEPVDDVLGDEIVRNLWADIEHTIETYVLLFPLFHGDVQAYDGSGWLVYGFHQCTLVGNKSYLALGEADGLGNFQFLRGHLIGCDALGLLFYC